MQVRAVPRRWPLHAGFSIGLLLWFAAAVAAGQAFDNGPSRMEEAANLFGVAIRGGP